MRFWRFDHVWQNPKSITYAASIMGGRTTPSPSATYPSKVVCNHAGVAFAFWVIPILSIRDLQHLCPICLARVDLRRRAIQGHPQGVLQDVFPPRSTDSSISLARNVSGFHATFFGMLSTWSGSFLGDMTRTFVGDEPPGL
jgi:hypothetical protein